VWTQFDLKSGNNLIWAEVLKPLPADFGLIVGDCLHNLRSSLDNLAYELLAAYQKGQPSKSKVNDSGFPIFRQQRDFASKGKSMIRGIHPDAQTLIEKLQPYNRGNGGSTLFVLSRLHNMDKHLVPHVAVVPQPETITFFTTNPLGIASDTEGIWKPIERRAVIGWYAPSGEHYTEMDMQRLPTFRIAFGERAPDVVIGKWVTWVMRRTYEHITLDITPALIRYFA
jgi:hypothetical protein